MDDLLKNAVDFVDKMQERRFKSVDAYGVVQGYNAWDRVLS